MDKSRQQFEGEYKKQFPYSPNSVMDENIKDAFWKFWQASRESLEIELPDLGDVILDDYFVDGFNDAISEVEKILVSNGVKIKNE